MSHDEDYLFALELQNRLDAELDDGAIDEVSILKMFLFPSESLLLRKFVLRKFRLTFCISLFSGLPRLVIKSERTMMKMTIN